MQAPYIYCAGTLKTSLRKINGLSKTMNPKEWFVTHFVLFLLLLETKEHCKQQKYRHLQRNPHFMTSRMMFTTLSLPPS